MTRRQFDEDWERKKEYLVRPLIADAPVLSPIPEDQELSSFVDQPLHLSDSPLPELIVERQKRRRHDKSKKFYDKLEIKMKKFYRKLFLGEDVNIGESISDNDSSESLTKDSESLTGENGSEGKTNSIDDFITILDPIENADQITETECDTSLTRSDENNENTPVAFLNSSEKEMDLCYNYQFKREKYAERNTDFHAITRISQENALNDEVKELLSQTFTEQLEESNINEDDLESSLSNEKIEITASDNSKSSNRKRITVVDKAIVHATKDKYQEEPETMRKQRASFLGELLHSDRDNTPKNLRLDLNIAYLTMEQMSDSTSSTINSPDSMLRSIIQTTPPMRLDSPILCQKRPSNDLYNKPTKKIKVKDEIKSVYDKNDNICQNISIDHNTSNRISSSLSSRDVEVQVHCNINHIAIQTDSVNQREVGIQTEEDEEYVRCRHASTQTEQVGRRDQDTRTGGRFFEYCRIYIINSIIVD